MSEKLEKLLEDLIAEQKETSFYTLTLERDRLLAALMEAGLGIPALFSTEFILAPGATQVVIQAVPPGFVAIGPIGRGTWDTSLPWWCTYSFWQDTTPPALPIATGIRMPGHLATFDFKGIRPVRYFLYHQVTNNHATETAYCLVYNAFGFVTVETWDMIRAVYLDALVERVRKMALEISGVQR